MTMSENLRGALLMIGSMVAFTMNDACIKAIGEALPLMQILVLRSIGVIVFLTYLAWRLGQLRLPTASRDRWLILLRCVAEASTAWFFLTALRNMPLANATAVLQLLSLTITLAGAIAFREPLGWRRLTAIGIGFLGMLLIVRPGTEGFNLYSVYALLAVVGVTVRDLAARALSPQCPTVAVSLAAVLFVMGMSAVGSAFVEWEPVAPRSAVLLAGSTIFIIGAYLFSVTAMRHGEIGFVAPFRYTGLVAALLLGFVFFGDWPQPMTFLGAGLIVGTGLFTLFRERSLGAIHRRQGLRIR